MEPAVHGITAPPAVYELEGRRFVLGAQGFAEAIADAHASHRRPRCMCLVEGAEMYVARLGNGYIVKRMPETGNHHAPNCPSFEPLAESSGLGQVLGSAIAEDTVTGETTLKLDFPLTKMPSRSKAPPTAGASDRVTGDDTRLSLRGLLHYLWDQAELTRWHPGFANKRTWGTVRKHLLRAAENKIAGGSTLRARLYVPEPFSIDQLDAINMRRMAQWQDAVAQPGKPQHFMLLIGEVKEIAPARYGFKAIVKHLPDQAFAVDEHLYRRLGRCFDKELTLWGATGDVHMVIAATFSVSSTGVPAIAEMSLMPVTAQWLPIEDAFERRLVERLVADKRAFIKGLRYNLGRDQCVATATLTDTANSVSLYVLSPARVGAACDGASSDTRLPGDAPVWVWKPASEPMPQLPLPGPA